MTCAKCGSEKLFRSHRKSPADLILSALLIYPYRCHECKTRAYTRSRSKTQAVAQNWERIRLQLLVFGFAALCSLVLIYFLIKERAPASE